MGGAKYGIRCKTVYPTSIIGVTQNFLQGNRPTLERLLRAYVEGVATMVHDKDRAVNILARYLRRTDRVFLDEIYDLVRTYTERILRFDPRAIAILLEFEQAKGVDPDAFAAKVIDTSILDQSLDIDTPQLFTGSMLREGFTFTDRVLKKLTISGSNADKLDELFLRARECF